MKTCKTLKSAHLRVEPGSVVIVSDEQYALAKDYLELAENASSEDTDTSAAPKKGKKNA